MPKITVQLKRIASKDDLPVPLPIKAHPSDAGFDLCTWGNVFLEPGERYLASTGIAIAIPEGYAGLILPRSGLAYKKGVTVLNAPGLIDPHYRGEVRINLINLGSERVMLKAYSRVAQLFIVPFPDAEIIEVDHLDKTDRGASGHGSSGV